MLRPHEISAGYLEDADDLSLMLPRSQYEDAFLLSPQADGKMAIFLGERFPFRSFECTGNTHWEGMIIRGVSIEVDESSATQINGLPCGSLARRGTSLDILAMVDDGHFKQARFVPVMAGLSPMREGMAVGFTRWTVAIGTGDDRRELLRLDAAEVHDEARYS